MKDFPFILVTASLVIRFLAQVSADCKVKSGTGLALNGYAYFTFSANDFIQCFDRCKAGEPICQSLNYNSDTKSCDLNNGTRTVHASDMIENPMAIYFESHNRVSRGSQATVAASSCKAIHFKENSAKDGLYWLNSNGTEPPFLTFCKMKNGGDTSDSFDLIFQDRNTNNFVVIDTSFPDLSAFTVCFWFKSFERQLVFLSYATHSFTDAIMMFLSSGGLFRFLVLDRQTHGQTGTFHDKAWHHVCGTWADNDGIVRLFIDGTCKFSGNVAIHGMISGTGKLVLGQDQDTLGGGFDYHQSFVGELSHLYLWNTDLGSSVISHLSIVCKEDPHPHYIVEWSQFMKGINGNVTRRDQSRCVTKRRLLH